MSYLTKKELEQRFSDTENEQLMHTLSDDEKDTKISHAIDDAQSLANAYLSKRYTVPVASSSMLKRIIADIARYHLFEQLSTEEVETRYKQQIAFLKDIACGKADLTNGDNDGADVQQNNGGSHVVSSASKLALESY